MADKVGQTGSYLMEKREIITKAIEKIKHHYKPQKIILFGSFAWGKPAKDSDIDFLIVKKTELKHRERSLVVRKIISEENALSGIDILVYTPEEVEERLTIGDSFISKIFRKGKVLYG
jgi:predicted nucleotidyltransferase